MWGGEQAKLGDRRSSNMLTRQVNGGRLINFRTWNALMRIPIIFPFGPYLNPPKQQRAIIDSGDINNSITTFDIDGACYSYGAVVMQHLLFSTQIQQFVDASRARQSTDSSRPQN
ncbi:hypothetical protein TWF225_003686 [Orbilia oligospora]|uniref:Uncharacterized protein n=1 Tax=Orbilia oligospora TaxID=2813651 RepID=A0A8H2DQL6_ORBOL|nr:hypothetical protein TWF225_003686 [Orbilia oligospora]KAF3267594.1 hypothetical protein TWF128_009122 [Orbilia oligospora]KAF3269197.1 hypothetical protein TWF217_009291 [Orbilia oligospora]TGJ63072.1 hypothetical protein EYR41_011020 [Orbilia oligospora]